MCTLLNFNVLIFLYFLCLSLAVVFISFTAQVFVKSLSYLSHTCMNKLPNIQLQNSISLDDLLTLIRHLNNFKVTSKNFASFTAGADFNI